ncbi:porin family protein [Aggregatibacter segnis]|uniref:outer membrane protein n=1 Tax=Aggregatibacter segnis TaxID=739 RepID=UPI000DAC935C|nr:porin family protein [Aggregatibacter segnis]RDE66801.1 porin family protein [Aggregatibacter segnis]
MKKLTLLALSAVVLASTSAVASDFTGFGVGVGVGTTKYEDAKRISNVDLIADYGFNHGQNVVGIVEGKLKPHNSTLVDNANSKVQQKGRLGVGYLLGYRATPSVLPYAKVSAEIVKFDATDHFDGLVIKTTETKAGYGLGAGVKANLAPNFELGLEYLRTSHKFDGENVKGNTFSTNASYRF